MSKFRHNSMHRPAGYPSPASVAPNHPLPRGEGRGEGASPPVYRQPSTVSATPGPRSGITLLEVLISIGILAVGILSMAGLLQLGHHHLTEATKMDRGDTLGRAAYRDLAVRGYLRPEMWVWWDNSQTRWEGFVDDFADSNGVVGPGGTSISAMAIDPLFLAGKATTAEVRRFPYNLPGTTSSSPGQMMRCNLRAAYDETASATSPQLADRLFRASDDLIFTQPEDAQARPRQLFGFNGSAASRLSTGDYSWMLTVSPSVAEMLRTRMVDTTSSPDPYDYSKTRQFTVSVVVFYKRDMVYPSAEEMPRERMLEVMNAGNDFPGSGSSGGDVRLKVASGNEAWLDIKPGQWLMLSASVPDSLGGPDRVIAEWYRIATVDTDTAGKAQEVFVRLVGPDWPVKLFDTPPKVQTYATIVDGVTSVYRKTIELEGSSPFFVRTR